MAGFILKKVNGSSLIEVVVAMVIVVAVFSMGITIYSNVLKSSVSIKSVYAKSVLSQLLKQSSASAQLGNKTFTHEGLIIKKEVSIYNNQPSLKEVHLIALDEKQGKLAEIRKVVYANE